MEKKETIKQKKDLCVLKFNVLLSTDNTAVIDLHQTLELPYLLTGNNLLNAQEQFDKLIEILLTTPLKSGFSNVLTPKLEKLLSLSETPQAVSTVQTKESEEFTELDLITEKQNVTTFEPNDE